MPSAPSPHVLIVDDEEGMVETLGDILEALRYRVSRASSGEDAVALVGAGAVDVVLMDVVMPGMNGFEALQAMRAVAPNLPVAMMTAFPRHALAEQMRRTDLAAFFTKPVEIDTILSFLAGIGGPAA